MKMQMGVTQKMKLYNVYRLCKNNIENVNNIILIKQTDSVYKMTEWHQSKRILDLLRKIPALKENADNCLRIIPDFSRDHDQFRVDISVAKNFEIQKNALLNKMQVITEFYESMNISDTGNNGIDIKLPPCENLKEYISYLKELDFIFSQCPFLQCENEVLKFESVDVGSNWIKLAVAATSTCIMLKNIGSLVDTAFALRSHYISIQQHEEMLKSAQMKNELTDEVIETFTSLKNVYLSKAVSNLEEKCGSLKDGEEKGKAEKALKKLCILLDKGMEIYASIDAPEDVQLLFPEIQGNLELPGELMKYLEDKESAGESSNAD